ncbi:MAG: DmsE family decaheme c-type cytochrome [Elusimicrobiota bacterium]
MRFSAIKATGWITFAAAAAILLGVMQNPESRASAQGSGDAELIGSSTCSACHTDHAKAFEKTLHGRKLPVVKNIPLEKSCETCHGPGSKHAEAGGNKNDPGFSTIGKVSADTCLSCHKGGETKLWDVSAHAQAGLDCTKCHGVHKGEGTKNLILSPNETCLQCHKKNRLAMNLPSHHPMKEGKMSCASCHNPHGGEFGNLRAENTTELCFKCHAEKAGPFIHEHPPVSEDCKICHEPHGSQNHRLLKKKQPLLCLGCHKLPHWSTGAIGTPSLQVRRLYYQCTNCHREIHGSDQKKRFVP